MKTFKEFLQNKKKEKYPVLSWDSSFREQKQPIPVLSWDSSFREHECKNTVKDQLTEGFSFNDKLSIYYDDRHDKKYLKHGILKYLFHINLYNLYKNINSRAYAREKTKHSNLGYWNTVFQSRYLQESMKIYPSLKIWKLNILPSAFKNFF